MANFTIFTHTDDLSTVPKRLRKLYGEGSVKVEGDDSDWTSIEVVRRRLLRKSTIRFNALRGGPQMEQMVKGMRHVFAAVPTEHTEIQAKLLHRIDAFRSAIGIVVDGNKSGGLEDMIFSACKAVDGLVFWDGNQLVNAKGLLVMDFQGRCQVHDLEVEGMEDQSVELPEDALERKAQTEEWLQEMNVPMNPRLPVIEGEGETEIRSGEMIAWRAFALMLVALKGEGLEQSILERIHADFGLEGRLSPEEQAFFEAAEPDQQSRVNFAWRYESLFVMLWALGYADELGYPGGICDVQAAVVLLRESGGAKALLTNANLRSKKEILDEADRIYRLHWAVRDARLRGEGAPADLDAGVVYERHYALNWLIGYFEADWDDVSTDT